MSRLHTTARWSFEAFESKLRKKGRGVVGRIAKLRRGMVPPSPPRPPAMGREMETWLLLGFSQDCRVDVRRPSIRNASCGTRRAGAGGGISLLAIERLAKLRYGRSPAT